MKKSWKLLCIPIALLFFSCGSVASLIVNLNPDLSGQVRLLTMSVDEDKPAVPAWNRSLAPLKRQTLTVQRETFGFSRLEKSTIPGFSVSTADGSKVLSFVAGRGSPLFGILGLDKNTSLEKFQSGDESELTVTVGLTLSEYSGRAAELAFELISPTALPEGWKAELRDGEDDASGEGSGTGLFVEIPLDFMLSAKPENFSFRIFHAD